MNGAIPGADITIATHWVTVEPAYKYGTGKITYFMQHFEPLSLDDNNEYDYFKCITNYTLPIAKIANSTWAQNTVQSFLADRNTPDNVWLANNGIDLNTFKNLNLPRERRHEKHI